MQPREEATVRVKSVLIWGVVLLLIAVALLWWRGAEWFGGPAPDGSEFSRGDRPTAGELASGEVDSGSETPTRLEQDWTEQLGRIPDWPVDPAAPAECQEIDADLVALCREIDGWPSMEDRLVGGSSCLAFRQLAEDLAATPPVVGGELASYPTILANVFHVFRTVGRKRVALLRDLTVELGDRDEVFAFVANRWLLSREACDGQSAIGSRPLYDYAAFVIQTVGGRAYMSRRKPRTEGLIGFYALMIIDRADASGFNPDGIDPRNEIARVRKLLVDEPLMFRDRYLDALDLMDSRWQARTVRN